MIKNRRKIILSTNVAETSLTIPDIVHVVDSGRVKTKSITNSMSGYSTMSVECISKASAWQRAGRAGRQRSGYCYRLYSEAQYKKFGEFSKSEILRCNLDSVIMQMFAAGVDQIQSFKFLESPSQINMRSSLIKLKQCNLIEMANGYQSLTELGRKVSMFPLSPELALSLLKSVEYNCLYFL